MLDDSKDAHAVVAIQILDDSKDGTCANINMRHRIVSCLSGPGHARDVAWGTWGTDDRGVASYKALAFV